MTARPRRGHTLLELLLALGLLAILVGALLGALLRDARAHIGLAARADARAQLQAGALALARDLRSLSARAGDFAAGDRSDTGVTIRALHFTAVACDTAGVLAVRQPARADGVPPAEGRLPVAGDSAWVLVEQERPRWVGARVTRSERDPGACPGGGADGVPVRLWVDAAGLWPVALQAPVRVTRRARWSAYRATDGWQLGVREWNASLGRLDPPQPVAGPLSPATGAAPGLALRWLDSLGADLAAGAEASARLARVEVVLRAARLARTVRRGELGADSADVETSVVAVGRTEPGP